MPRHTAAGARPFADPGRPPAHPDDSVRLGAPSRGAAVGEDFHEQDAGPLRFAVRGSSVTGRLGGVSGDVP